MSSPVYLSTRSPSKQPKVAFLSSGKIAFSNYLLSKSGAYTLGGRGPGERKVAEFDRLCKGRATARESANFESIRAKNVKRGEKGAGEGE